MPDNDQITEPTNEPAVEPATEPAESKEPEDGEKPEPKMFDEAYVKQLRDESASYRTKLREAEDRLKEAKTPEEVEAIRQEMAKEREEEDKAAAERQHALLVENVALTYKLPPKLAKKLSGTTREELEADAKELAEFAPKADDDEDIDLEGGLSPRNRDSDPDDPAALARKYRKRKR